MPEVEGNVATGSPASSPTDTTTPVLTLEELNDMPLLVNVFFVRHGCLNVYNE